jgi:phosphatidylglycerophosphate synthase
MIDDAARALLPRVAGPVVRLYARLGLSPNAVSAIGFAIAVAAAGAVALGVPLAAIALWWLSRLVDGTDGIHARTHGLATDFGAYLDIVLDMAAYTGMILGFAIQAPSLWPSWLAIVALYVLCITTALALGMQEQKRGLPPRDERGLRLGAGLAEGGETGIAYTLFLLFPAALGPLAAAWIAVLLTTVAARSVLAYRTLAGERTAAG